MEIIIMKRALLVLVLSCGVALSDNIPCCPGGELIKIRGYCDDGVKVNLNCTDGLLVLRDVVLTGYKVSTLDTPKYVFVEDPKLYCLGDMYRNFSNPSLGTTKVALVCFEKVARESNDIETGGVMALVSVIFFILTFGVYMYLPQLRDLQGWCYMSLCVCMALGFFFLGLLQLNPGFINELCTVTGFFIYFWMMATFFWMNVISINVYRTVQDSTYLKKTEKKQFLLYSCYAWGGSIFFLAVTLITNFVEGEHYKPGIGSAACWFSGAAETWIYFYGPVAVLIASNIALFVFSSLQLWKQSKKYEVNTLNILKQKFLTSLKLFLVMGISWTFEIASFAHGGQHIIWKIMDTFNCLQGVVIFVILVLLRKRAMRGLAEENCCLFVTRPIADKLSPHDDSDDQEILADDTTEIRLN
ncbi:probable G-protein coupled receptor Mth-like 3 [Aricia agestis]|uniref:probable G-protein coupled receptor Mth-like 3 n=1 Tax=Aricia agestis TaxID=91739 RepID=UPI001C20BD28|nr:probable G-protein coupled receptor Mth-like 3 [Aricia agestis]